MTPDAPARHWWADTWRLLVGVAGGAAVTLGVYGTGLSTDGGMATRPSAALWFFLVEPAGLVTSAVLYALRRRAPLPVTGAVVVVASFAASAAGVVALAVVSLATRRRWSQIVPVGLLWCGGALAGERAFDHFVYSAPSRSLVDLVAVLVGPLVLYALLVLTGMYVGGRRALLASLREQAAIARREADARGDSARAAERNRIAREMHDVLAHRLSLVALHSGALEYRAGLDPRQVRETAAVVRDNAHAALGELREVLGLLRDSTGPDEHSRPQPTFAQVGELVDGARAAGSPVTLVLEHLGEEDLARLPVPVSRHLYRVVQETLTNARKHAPGERVQVRLHGTPGEHVTVEVSNPLPTHAPLVPLPASGWGLTGLAERVRLTGGELDARPRPDRTFVVRARLPWPAPDAQPSAAGV